MALDYKVQDPQYVFGPTPVTLTTAYAGNVSQGIPLSHYSEDTVYVDYVPLVSGSSIQIIFEGSPDDYENYPSPPAPTTNVAYVAPVYYQQTSASVSNGVITLTAADYTFVGTTAGTHYRFYFYLPPAHCYGRFSMKETSGDERVGTPGVATVQLLKSGG